MPELYYLDTGDTDGGSDPFLEPRLDASADPYAGTTAANGKPIWTVDHITQYLNRTHAGWNGLPGQPAQSDADQTTINFGFHTSQASLQANGYVFAFNGGLYGLAEYFNFTPFSDAQKAAARVAMGLWDDVISVKFAETNVNSADIAFGDLTSAPTTQAYSYLPLSLLSGNPTVNAQIQDIAGDVWVSLSQSSNLALGFGGYGLTTLIHEIGHSLGLSHPGAYNASPGVSITYPVNAEYYQDSRQYTVMSYFNAEFTGGGHIDWGRLNWVYAQTPLVHDIAAMQAIYGADPTTRAGDTVYGFNSTADKAVYDFAQNSMPVLAIYDAGGEDTLDFSGWSSSSVIDLNPGAFSSGGGSGVVPLDQLKAAGLLPASYTEEQYLALRAKYNAVDGMLHDNISIAYGTVIENAVGGGGNDLLVGNAAANKLSGNAGDDGIAGGDGNDRIDGGLGADTMMGGKGDDHYVVDNAGDVVSEQSAEGFDDVLSHVDYTLTDNVEVLQLTGSAVSGTGNALANLIVGDALGNRLDGVGGDDRLIGGDGFDYLRGGDGSDVFVGEIDAAKLATKLGTLSINAVLDFAKGQDKIDLSGIDAKAGGALDAFTFKGTDMGKNAGDLYFKTYDSVNGAEKALGVDLDGVSGASPYEGKVTVVFGNVDGGNPDFAMVLFKTAGVSTDDFILVENGAFGSDAAAAFHYTSGTLDHLGTAPLLV
jgi:serralysin